MSQRKPKRFEIWVEGNSPFPPEIARLLPNLILELALLDDVTGPLASEIGWDKYIAEAAPRWRESVARRLREAGIGVSESELARICQVSASEVFVIRWLNEARLEGEILVEDFNHLPFYPIYQAYFEQSPEIVEKAFRIAIHAAALDRASRSDTNKRWRSSAMEQKQRRFLERVWRRVFREVGQKNTREAVGKANRIADGGDGVGPRE